MDTHEKTRRIAWTTLLLGGSGLAACAVWFVLAMNAESGTAAIGMFLALLAAIPLLLAIGLTAAGLLATRRSAGRGTGLIWAGAAVLGTLAAFAAMLFGPALVGLLS